MIAKLAICAAVVLLADPPQQKTQTEDAKAGASQTADAPPDAGAKDHPAPETATKQAEKDDPNKAKDPLAELDLLPIEQNVIYYTNAERKRYGLPPLRIDPKLVQSARRHCAWMTRNRTLQHTRQAVAENIAMGYPNSKATVGGWMNSSGHRANILNGGYRYIGAAAYRTPGGTVYWCQQFRR